MSLLHKSLPTLALYRSKCHSSSYNWFAYLSSTTEIRLLQYDHNLAIIQSFTFIINTEPVKNIKIIFDPQEKVVYLAVTYITRYVIYAKNEQICSQKLKLDRNIVSFSQTFVSCQAVNDGKQIYFMFATSKGQIYLQTVSNPKQKQIIGVSPQNRICSIAGNSKGNAILGDQKGIIYQVDMNISKILNIFDTKSKFPITQLSSFSNYILACTCQGQIYVFQNDLKSFKSASIHGSMINIMHIGQNNKIYTFGDDCVLNILSIGKQGQIVLVKSKTYLKRANIFWTICNRTMINFYEQTALTQI